ncbi:hypothetical protein MAHJHV55_18080 [Mycobacterium avium subsp. hominissuis]
MVGLLAPPARIGRRSELFQVRASLIVPSLQMPLTQAAAASGSLAPGGPALGSTEQRVLRTELQDITAEFAAHYGHQLAQQP